MTALHYMVSGLMNYEARARLVEWCVSVPVMMLNIAALSGVTDSANLAAVAICSCICMLLGLVQEGSRNTLLGTSVTGSVFK
jgi:bacteriorhodopsin